MRITILSAGTFFLLFLAKVANADTFIVTSNADSGPGTLRDAINKSNANGTAFVDNIHFNLPDISRDGRTIILQSEFPLLTSNLIIDGTTQTGTAIGTSNAKIILLVNKEQLSLFTIFKFHNATNIQFYGLFLFNEVFTVFSPYYPVNGIEFSKSTNIIIGKPGQGNYFRGLKYAIHSTVIDLDDRYNANSSDITIQSNVFNNDENGDPTILYQNPRGIINPMDYAINFYNIKNILIGGETINEGNSFAVQNIYILTFRPTDNGFVTLKNNFIGTRTDGTLSMLNAPYTKIEITGFTIPFSDYDITIVNNMINGGIMLAKLTNHFTIQGNKIFSNNGNGSWSGGDYSVKISIVGCTGGGIIGGEQAEEQNEIYVSAPIQNYSPWSTIPSGSIHIFGSPQVAIIKNTTTCTGFYGSTIQVTYSGQPHIQIDSTGIGYVRGKATPNVKIEVFKDDDCWACDGTVLLGETVSRADSSWSFSGNFTGTVIATAAISDGTTSGYTEPVYYASDVVVVQPTCGMNNGSITGIKLTHSTDNVEWHKVFDRNSIFIDSIVSREIDLLNVDPGHYYFVAKLGATCGSATTDFYLRNFSPVIDETYHASVNPSCGQSNGSITGLRVIDSDYSIYKWINDQGIVIATGGFNSSHDLHNVTSGRYKLIVTDTRVGCADSTGWYQLTNQSGPALNLNAVQITDARCGIANGSIKGITSANVTGAPFIQWTDSLSNPVGQSLDLINVPAGKYQLRFKDRGGCDTIITPYYIIADQGTLNIDMDNALITPSGCTVNNGAISTIRVTGANSWQWKNLTTNITAGNSVDITGLSAGNYQLTVSNAFGCTLSSPVIAVPQAPFATIIPQNVTIKNGSCGENNGSIILDGFSNQSALLSYYWINSTTNQIAGTQVNLTGLGVGMYEFVATDTNGCQKVIFTQPIIVQPKHAFNTGPAVLTDDQCSLQKGSVTGIEITGLHGPTTYTWTNANNLVVGGNSPDLHNVGTGDYRLTVSDQGNCIIQSGLFIIKNFDNAGIAPLYDEMMIQRNTAANLNVKNFRNGTYILYSDAAGTLIIQQNTTGTFTTPILNDDRDFYVRHIEGSCQSPLAKIKITVVDNSLFAIPTAFTPNQDGLNDKLTLKVIGYIEVEYFRIYNRNGELVFSTNVVNTGWDGNLKGAKQPVGAYVWMAKGKDITNRIITDKGNFVLIR